MDQAQQTRFTAIDTPDGLEVSIPAPRHWFVLAFLGVWLTGWAFGEVTALESLYSSRDSLPAAGFLLFWLAGWTLAGAFTGYLFLWMAVGKERVLVRADALMIRREILGLGRVRSYDLMTVRNMRVEMPKKGSPRSSRVGWGLIAFDFNAQTVRFGMVFSAEEAQQIVDRIRGRFSITTDPAALQAQLTTET